MSSDISDQPPPALLKLASGVAHEINNLVLALDLNLDWLNDIVGDNPEAAEPLESMTNITDQAREIARRLLVFAGRLVLSPEVINLNTWLLSQSFEALKIQCPDHPLKIQADPIRLTGALQEILKNAKNAGSALTTLTIDAVLTSHATPYVVISVIDSGVGMSATMLDAALNPFFTSELRAGCLGLGLSEVDGFMRASGGSLRLQSEPGAGTIVKLYFPAA